ncbi:hypothetical protein G9A89_010505 [Geosiphon pyriformis]|nr:hypothetical protein G9A89_010505 [Geosiphon pyriformis]
MIISMGEIDDGGQKTLLAPTSEVIKELRIAAWYASLGYCLKKFKHKLNNGIFANVDFVEGIEQSTFNIYFKGPPYRLKEWLSRKITMVIPSVLEPAMVDRFFYEEWLKSRVKFKNLMTNTLTKIVEKKTNLSIFNFIGHCVGGVIATLAAIDYSRTLEDLNVIIQVFTFGQPRVGDLEFAKIVNKRKNLRIYRVTHSDDIVPRLPRRQQILNPDLQKKSNFELVHSSEEYWINPDCDCSDELIYRCSGKIKKRLLLESKTYLIIMDPTLEI